MYDVIVVGGRCAGAPLAMLLARQGHRVLVVDKAHFPSEPLSTHYIQRTGMARLRDWGLFDQVAAAGAPAIDHWRFDVGPFAVTGNPPAYDGIRADYAPRRAVLDQILIEAAAQAGAEVRTGFAVQEILFDGDRVTGIRGRSENGATVSESARIVIGADGMRSFVARSVQAPATQADPSQTCTYYSYFANVQLDGIELNPRPYRAVITFPTNDNLTLIGVQWPGREMHTFRSDIEGNFLASLDLVPDLAERVRGGERVDRFYGTADLPFFFRKPSGPGWALAGDAGLHIDPCTGQGISNAFRDADLLARAIDDGFSGRQDLESALAGYEAERYAQTGEMYGFTLQNASLEPAPPDLQRILGALPGNQPAIDQFLGLICGNVRPSEFFAPANLDALLAVAVEG